MPVQCVSSARISWRDRQPFSTWALLPAGPQGRHQGLGPFLCAFNFHALCMQTHAAESFPQLSALHHADREFLRLCLTSDWSACGACRGQMDKPVTWAASWVQSLQMGLISVLCLAEGSACGACRGEAEDQGFSDCGDAAARGQRAIAQLAGPSAFSRN